MNRRSVAMATAAVLGLVVLAGAPAAAGARLAGDARAAASGGIWRKAIEVPGMAALNRDDNGQTTAVSCASAGNCAAGGIYTDA